MNEDYIGAPGEGRKFDEHKLKWNLLPFESTEEIVKVLTYGAIKYGEDDDGVANWKKLDYPNERYFAAMMRHLSSWKQGELEDQETGISHLAHAGANLLFLIYFNKQENE